MIRRAFTSVFRKQGRCHYHTGLLVLADRFNSWCKEFKVEYKTVEERNEAYKNFSKNYELFGDQIVSDACADFTYKQLEQMTLTSSLKRLERFKTLYPHAVEHGLSETDAVDWFDGGIVSRTVHDQGKCGCCTPFACKEAVDALYKIKHNEEVDVSAQDLVNQCIKCEKFGGCGGIERKAISDYLQQTGVVLNRHLPYVGCKLHHSITSAMPNSVPTHPRVRIADYRSMTVSAYQLLQILKRHPVVVSIQLLPPTEGEDDEWVFFEGGIYSDHCLGKFPNTKGLILHDVLLCGYGVDEVSGESVWKLKNSHGFRFGDWGRFSLSTRFSGFLTLREIWYPIDPYMTTKVPTSLSCL